MSNMMPGDNSGADPKDHDNRCATLCAFVDVPIPDGGECPEGHGSHDWCNCDALAEMDAENWAEAEADRLEREYGYW